MKYLTMLAPLLLLCGCRTAGEFEDSSPVVFDVPMTVAVNVDLATLNDLPLLGYSTVTKDSVSFSLYIREVGPLSHIYTKRLQVSDATAKRIVDCDLDFANRQRQGIPQLQFTVERSHIPSSHLILLDSTGVGSKRYQVSLALLLSAFAEHPIAIYRVSRRPEDEPDKRFVDFMTKEY